MLPHTVSHVHMGLSPLQGCVWGCSLGLYTQSPGGPSSSLSLPSHMGLKVLIVSSGHLFAVYLFV